MYAILDFARLPMAVLNGAGQIIRYVNPAFCHLASKSKEEMIGKSCAELMPEGDECLLRLDRVYRTGNTESHTEQEYAKPHPLYWFYEIWPVWEEQRDDGRPIGVVLQVTETAPLHRQASVMNEALLVSAVRQHELMEGVEVLNVKLRAEIQERQRAEAAIEQLAFYDPLTDLPNRRLLMDRLHLALLACCRTLHHGAILFIDHSQAKKVGTYSPILATRSLPAPWYLWGKACVWPSLPKESKPRNSGNFLATMGVMPTRAFFLGDRGRWRICR